MSSSSAINTGAGDCSANIGAECPEQERDAVANRNEMQNGIFYPNEVEDMADELKRRESPGGTKQDREELAAEIVRRTQREHEQAHHGDKRS
jgi:hypothetical protein